MKTKLIQTLNYLLLVDIEVKIQNDDFYIDESLTVRQSVMEYDKEYWSRRPQDYKIIGYYPLLEYATKLDLPLLPEFGVKVPLHYETDKLRTTNNDNGKQILIGGIYYY